MTTHHEVVAVIVDVSKSRSHPDRSGLQSVIQGAFADVNALVTSRQPI